MEAEVLGCFDASAILVFGFAGCSCERARPGVKLPSDVPAIAAVSIPSSERRLMEESDDIANYSFRKYGRKLSQIKTIVN
jgi:hypothetical protein